jgi:VanZ family protein
MPPTNSRVPSRRWLPIVGVLLLVAAALLFMFFAWRSSPRLGQLSWLPRDLTRWADRHGIARNVVGFFGLGVVCFALIGRRWPQVLLAAFFATALEVAQIWIPHRHFDRKDIYASLLGLALAWIVVTGIARALRHPHRHADPRPDSGAR